MKLLMVIAAMLGAATATPANDWKLTPEGWGPVRIGMTRSQVTKALNTELVGDAFDNEGRCIELYAPDDALPGMFFMFLDGKLSRISATKPNIKTPRNIGIDSTAAEVRKAYGGKLQAEPIYYIGDPPGEYLTYWIRPKPRGVRFEIGPTGSVATIDAGILSIQHVEGCA